MKYLILTTIIFVFLVGCSNVPRNENFQGYSEECIQVGGHGYYDSSLGASVSAPKTCRVRN